MTTTKICVCARMLENRLQATIGVRARACRYTERGNASTRAQDHARVGLSPGMPPKERPGNDPILRM